MTSSGAESIARWSVGIGHEECTGWRITPSVYTTLEESTASGMRWSTLSGTGCRPDGGLTSERFPAPATLPGPGATGTDEGLAEIPETRSDPTSGQSGV